MKNNKKIWFVLPVMALAVACGGGKEASKEAEEKKEETKEVPVKKAGDLKIAYVNMDTLSAHFRLVEIRTEEYKQLEERIQGQMKKAYNNMVAQQQKLEKDYPMMMQSDQAKAQEKAYKLQQDYAALEERLSQEAQAKQLEIMQGIEKVYSDFLNEYAEKNGYDIIFRQNAAAPIIVITKQYDITQDVLNKLNEEFARTNPGK
jgi:outer membrane protein